jgi:hypothetical protein
MPVNSAVSWVCNAMLFAEVMFLRNISPPSSRMGSPHLAMLFHSVLIRVEIGTSSRAQLVCCF